MGTKLLYVLPTIQCNLTCNHCFIKDRHEVFNREKFLHELNTFEGELTLFGGEPTMHLDRMFDIVEDNLKNGKSKIKYISTNLIKLDDRLLDFYKRLGHICTSWNPGRFKPEEYETWKNNCKTLSDNNVGYRIMVTLTDDLFQIPMNEFLDTAAEWIHPGIRDIKFEHYVGEEVTPEYFERADDWLCELYKAWDLPVKLELLGRLSCWKYDCDHVYTLFPDGTVTHSCPHNGKGHAPMECYTCERVDVCRPCKLQPYCSFPKKLEKLVTETEGGEGGMRNISTVSADGYPFYLHTDEKLIDYWKRYFEEYPLTDDQRVEVYIDFPFCRSICKFCVFGSLTTGEYKDKIKCYEDATVKLVQGMRDVFPTRINNVYFGGGTPSLWSKDAIMEIIKNIPAYNEARTRTIEVHPVDLTPEFLDFAINSLNIKTISIGVQSFDIDSNKRQNRIPADIDKIKQAIKILHDNGRYVNIDVVALFDKEADTGWDLFKKDLEIAADIGPDDICSSPNFRTSNYYGKSIYYRDILREFLEVHPEYIIEHPYSLSTNVDDIVRYGEEPYHMRTPEYSEFFNNCRVGVLDSNIDSIKENIVIGIGGSSKHNSISRLGMKMEDINTHYNFNRNKFIYMVDKTTIIPTYDPDSTVPIVRIGNCAIDNNIIIPKGE